MSAEPQPAMVQLDENPFLVLELEPSATPIEVERQKQKLLGMLELGLAKARSFATPAGDRPRTAELVRHAAQLLQDPARRLLWELWTARGDDQALGAAVRAHGLLHADVARGEPLDAAFLDAVGVAWDAALADDATYDLVWERGEALSIDDPDEALQQLADDAERQLAELVERAPPFDLDPLESEIAIRARQRFLDRAVEGLELAAERLSGAANPWAAWNAFAGHYHRAVVGRGAYAERCAFEAVYGHLSELAATRFNAGEHQPAASIFHWLAERAGSVGDEQAQQTQRENARIAARALEAPAVAYSEQRSGGGTAAWIIVAIVVIAAIRLCNSVNRSSPTIDTPRFEIDPAMQERMRESVRESIRESVKNLDRLPRPVPDPTP